MKWDENKNEFELSTGSRFYANRGLLCVFDDGRHDAGELTYGYDGTVGKGENFSPAERAEIAEYMVLRWLDWAGVDYWEEDDSAVTVVAFPRAKPPEDHGMRRFISVTAGVCPVCAAEPVKILDGKYECAAGHSWEPATRTSP